MPGVKLRDCPGVDFCAFLYVTVAILFWWCETRRRLKFIEDTLAWIYEKDTYWNNWIKNSFAPRFHIKIFSKPLLWHISHSQRRIPDEQSVTLQRIPLLFTLNSLTLLDTRAQLNHLLWRLIRDSFHRAEITALCAMMKVKVKLYLCLTN
jgi:hypothetical protein